MEVAKHGIPMLIEEDAVAGATTRVIFWRMIILLST